MTRLDRDLAAAITAHRAAQKRGDTRAVHDLRARMKTLRTEQLRRDVGWRGKLRRVWATAREWIGPLSRIAGTFALFMIAGVVWCIVDAPDAYASELTPWNSAAISSKAAAYCFAAVFCLAGVVFLLSRMLNAPGGLPSDDLYEDPDKAQPRNRYDIDSWSERR